MPKRERDPAFSEIEPEREGQKCSDEDQDRLRFAIIELCQKRGTEKSC